MNEWLKPEDSRDELINSLSGSYCISHVMNERLQPEDSRDELINSLSGSYFISHVMNERLKPEDSRWTNQFSFRLVLY